jgi:hypothetical protein
MSQSKSKRRFKNQKEAAEYIGKDVRTIQRWIKKELLPRGKGNITEEALDFAKMIMDDKREGLTIKKLIELRQWAEQVEHKIKVLEVRIDHSLALCSKAKH